MKMTTEHYEEMTEKIDYFIDNHSSDVAAHYMAHNFKRFAWDIYNAARCYHKELYDYLNDSHIETALKSILKRHEFV